MATRWGTWGLCRSRGLALAALSYPARLEKEAGMYLGSTCRVPATAAGKQLSQGSEGLPTGIDISGGGTLVHMEVDRGYLCEPQSY